MHFQKVTLVAFFLAGTNAFAPGEFNHIKKVSGSSGVAQSTGAHPTHTGAHPTGPRQSHPAHSGGAAHPTGGPGGPGGQGPADVCDFLVSKGVSLSCATNGNVAQPTGAVGLQEPKMRKPTGLHGGPAKRPACYTAIPGSFIQGPTPIPVGAQNAPCYKVGEGQGGPSGAWSLSGAWPRPTATATAFPSLVPTGGEIATATGGDTVPTPTGDDSVPTPTGGDSDDGPQPSDVMSIV